MYKVTVYLKDGRVIETNAEDISSDIIAAIFINAPDAMHELKFNTQDVKLIGEFTLMGWRNVDTISISKIASRRESKNYGQE